MPCPPPILGLRNISSLSCRAMPRCIAVCCVAIRYRAAIRSGFPHASPSCLIRRRCGDCDHRRPAQHPAVRGHPNRAEKNPVKRWRVRQLGARHALVRLPRRHRLAGQVLKRMARAQHHIVFTLTTGEHDAHGQTVRQAGRHAHGRMAGGVEGCGIADHVQRARHHHI